MLTLINILVVRRLTLGDIMIDVGLLYPNDSGWRINRMWKFDCFHQHPTLPRTIPLGLWDPLLTAILRWSYLHFPSWSTAYWPECHAVRMACSACALAVLESAECLLLILNCLQAPLEGVVTVTFEDEWEIPYVTNLTFKTVLFSR